MDEPISADLCVIGAGSGGLSVAAGAARLGARVVLIERGAMGGDCLNSGCVPSKALLAAAKAAAHAREARRFGVTIPEIAIDADGVWNHVFATIDAIAPHDGQERFEGLGVTVIRDSARFVDPGTVMAGGRAIRARRFVIATGSRPAIPPIPGLAETPHLTNESLFDRQRPRSFPASLIILGGGPIGMEMAQAHQRLGVTVTVVERDRVLPRDDADLAAVVRDRLVAEGVTVIEGAAVTSVSAVSDGGVAVALDDGRRMTAAALLVATGRLPNVEGLGLDAAGVAHDHRGIATDRRMRTSNSRTSAVGDVTGRPAFTHWAAAQASVVVKNIMFRWPARLAADDPPHVTYTDPELAQVGLSEAAARARHGDSVRVIRQPLAENDRARAEGVAEGLVKLILDRRGRVLGVGIVGAGAGELIAPWCVALAGGVRLSTVAGMTLPYPTLAESGKAAAGAHFAPNVFGRRARWLARLLSRL